MRIIAGQFKGKKILDPRDKNTRPLKDLVKESIFNIIDHSNKLSIKINNSNILDLFSGVGSFGLEALSRGANHITFVENYSDVLAVLKKNIKSFELDSRCRIVEKNIFNDLNFNKFDKNFDIIFLDPPFKEKEISLLLYKIHSSKILKSNGIIIIHRNSKIKENLLNEFKIVEEKKYGVSKIIFGNYF